MSAPSVERLVPRYPDDWRALVSGPRWGRRLAAAIYWLFAALICWPLVWLVTRSDTGLVSGALVGFGFAVMLAVLGCLHWPFAPSRSLPTLTRRDDGLPELTGGRQLRRVLAIAVPCLIALTLSLQLWVDRVATVPRANRGVALFGVLLAFTVWYLWRRVSAPRQFSVTVSAAGVKPPLAKVIPWSQIHRVDPWRGHTMNGPRYPGFKVPTIEILAQERQFTIKAHDLGVHPAVLLNLLQWGLAHPDLRERLDDPTTLQLLTEVNAWAAASDRDADNHREQAITTKGTR